MTFVKPKKRLGQHFLRDTEIARRIAETLPIESETSVLEIGPGTGMLTRFLANNHLINLTAVELDCRSVEFLHKNFPTLKVIEADFLKMNLKDVFPEKFMIIGNFPYNISSQILFKMLDYKDDIPVLAGMFQRELALRISSPAGRKAYGILSVFIQAYYDVEYLFEVSEEAFDPPPKVKSAVIRLTRNKVEALPCDEKLFRTVVKTSFNQRRKTLRNSLKPILPQSKIYADKFFDKRPEQLDVQQFVNLTNLMDAELQNNRIEN
ncbi:MAG: 16S rRNA (adenine(1518)-N(6)/adenine(1519)-N(6))-dimethyltransferase RsmA [Prevotellaceae bacterium]|jgi:16S rRNA (adenine1518-N6/adenine1519-N6)-dimethyltransferase|nr:16S rRNA (adenine(1518)-N(6)/adenine(1519)-N(6))-dimethyltransferase RsmA [Prevotellaceae bacterium]